MDDLISRQAAIDALKRNTFRLTFAEEQNCEGHVAWSAKAVYSEVMEGVLLDLPSAQSEEVTPHRNYKYLSDYWCECGNHLGKKGSVTFCSDCGRKVKLDE